MSNKKRKSLLHDEEHKNENLLSVNYLRFYSEFAIVVTGNSFFFYCNLCQSLFCLVGFERVCSKSWQPNLLIKYDFYDNRVQKTISFVRLFFFIIFSFMII